MTYYGCIDRRLPTKEETDLEFYNDYVKNGDPFFPDDLDFKRYVELRDMIKANMNKHGANCFFWLHAKRNKDDYLDKATPESLLEWMGYGPELPQEYIDFLDIRAEEGLEHQMTQEEMDCDKSDQEYNARMEDRDPSPF
jgi:hypothetical protein